LEERIASYPENTLFLHHVGPGELLRVGKCFEMIFDIEGNLYYYNHCQITIASEDGFISLNNNMLGSISERFKPDLSTI